MNVKKIIIPIAGLGTRMLPATKAIPKEMLPIVDKPIIQYIVEEVVEAGFKEIIFITHSSKVSVENHFDVSFELETILEKRVKRALLKEVKDISKPNVMIHSIRQGEQKGLGHAISCASSVIGDDPFGIILPDMLLKDNSQINVLKKMKKYYERNKISSLMLSKAPENELHKYGVVKLNDDKNSKEYKIITDIKEKPSKGKFPSHFFAVGRYIFSNNFMEFLLKEKPDDFGEIQLTNAISKFIKKGNKTLGFFHKGKFYDCGDKIGFLKANIQFGIDHKLIGKELKFFLSEILDSK